MQFFQGFDTQAQEIYYFRMIERTFELLVSQLIVFLSGLHQDMNGLAKWAIKVRKSYKALRIMEVHKTAEPKFARALKHLHSHLNNLRVAGPEELDSLGDSQIMLPAIADDGGIILQGGYGVDDSFLNNSSSVSTGGVLLNQTKKGVELTSAAKAQLGTAELRESMMMQATGEKEYLLDFKSDSVES